MIRPRNECAPDGARTEPGSRSETHIRRSGEVAVAAMPARRWGEFFPHPLLHSQEPIWREQSTAGLGIRTAGLVHFYFLSLLPSPPPSQARFHPCRAPTTREA